MKLYIIAGEASGDMHAADLIRELKKSGTNLSFRAWGGDLMKAEGAEIVKHYRDLAFMGFTEVIFNLRTILSNIKFCKEDILKYQPDALVLVDYPGFNLRIAKFAKQHGLKVYYYISPQVWAWKESRVNVIKHVVNKMFVILPFEKEFYKKFNYEVEFVGHPLPDVIARKKLQFLMQDDFLKKNNLSSKPIIALLPGSRKQEINTMLPLFLSVVKNFTEYQFVLAAAPSVPMEFYKSIIVDLPVSVINGQTYELLNVSFAALVTSGTATLETALLNVPQVVCYKGGRLSYLIARLLVKIRFISLVNLILNKEVVKELIQDNLSPQNLSDELNKILESGNRNRIFAGYSELQNLLNEGGAARKTALAILDDLK